MNARAQDKRFWLAGGAAMALLIIAIGWIAVISPQLSSAKTLRETADSARAQNSVLAAKTAKLKQQNDNVGKLRTTLRTALAALPFETGLPSFTRQLATQATHNKVALSSITIGVTSSAAGAGTTPAAATPTTAGSTATSAAAPPASAAPVSAAVMTISVTLLCKGSSKNQLAFLKAIQVDGPRRALVTATTLTAAGTSSIDKSASMTIQLSVFSTPMSAAARAQLAKLLGSK